MWTPEVSTCSGPQMLGRASTSCILGVFFWSACTHTSRCMCILREMYVDTHISSTTHISCFTHVSCTTHVSCITHTYIMYHTYHVSHMYRVPHIYHVSHTHISCITHTRIELDRAVHLRDGVYLYSSHVSLSRLYTWDKVYTPLSRLYTSDKDSVQIHEYRSEAYRYNDTSEAYRYNDTSEEYRYMYRCQDSTPLNHMHVRMCHLLYSPFPKRWGEVGGWGRDPKKCTGSIWGMGSSTI